MTTFKVWDIDYGEREAVEISAPLAYQAAEKYSEKINDAVREYPLCRTVHVLHPEGFIDIFEVELSSTPIYTARRKKP